MYRQARWISGGIFRHCVLCIAVVLLLLAFPATGFCQQATLPPEIYLGGMGWAWYSQFANPGFVGALYMTPDWPKTGYYPVYPGSFSRPIKEDGLSVGPARIHPTMGVAELYTDNAFRTNINRRSDFATILAPGIQAELPFGGSHSFVADYQTNIQIFHRNPSNNVEDQTASGRLSFNLPSGHRLDLQGEHKLGHDPRGSALDTQNVDVNKWTATGFRGQLYVDGANTNLRLDGGLTDWTYLNNDQGFRNRRSNNIGVTVAGNMSSRTSVLMNLQIRQELYDQTSSLSSTRYSVGTGLRWNITDQTSGEILGGYQFLKFNHAQGGQTSSGLQFPRTADSYGTWFFMGNMNWNPTPFLTVTMQGYRSFQQTVVLNNLFFTSTGGNLSAVHTLTDSTALTLNMGLEYDEFESATVAGGQPKRDDFIKSMAFGVRYRTVKWLGAGLQYIFEDRSSNVDRFNYYANTVMLSLQATF